MKDALGPIMVGLFKNLKFTYARGVVVPSASVSIGIPRISEDLQCAEALDREYEVEIAKLGIFKISAVCTVDKAIIDGQEIDLRTAIHIGVPITRRRIEYELIIGRDLINYWRLIYDELTGYIRSLVSRSVVTKY